MAISTSKLVTNLIGLIAFMLASPALASIGSITDLKGGGQIKRGAATQPANRNSGIEKMDTVVTNSQGKIHIAFVDATTVNITENSRLVIDDFVFDAKNSKSGRLGLKVALGTVRYASGALAHGNPGGVNIRTPTATIAVRGTDFVMSVDEAGRSTVVLVPNCFDDKDVTRTNFDCPAGEIEVATAAGVTLMNKPFQATVVENSFAPPSPAVTISPALKTMNNSIQVAPLATDDGQSLVKVARDAVKKFVNPSRAAADDNHDPNNDTGADIEQVAVATTVREATPTEDEKLYESINGAKPKQTIYTNVGPTYVKQIQEGWVYARLSDDKNQLVAIYVPIDTTAEIITSQNGVVDAYNFMNAKWTASGTGRPGGNITVIQNGAPAGK